MARLKFASVVFTLCAVAAANAAPRSAAVIIDAAPSVVSYQGFSANTYGKLVIAPMGRSLGYVEPTNLNQTLHTTHTRNSHTAFDISPVYVHTNS